MDAPSPSYDQVCRSLGSTKVISDVQVENDVLAFGTIWVDTVVNVVEDVGGAPVQRFVMRAVDGSVYDFPHPLLTCAERKGRLRIESLDTGECGAADGVQSSLRLRVYLLPEALVPRLQLGAPLREFKKLMKLLLQVVDCSKEAWNGTRSVLTSAQQYTAAAEDNEQSLFYIFNTLRSPDPCLENFGGYVYGHSAMYDVMEDTVAGLKTQLYPYQKRSVAVMIQKESHPAKITDVRLGEFSDLFGKPFRMDVHDSLLLADCQPPMYTEPQGGILAETMGYGKTLICLALILATKGHYPKVPEGRVDEFSYGSREKVGSLLAMAAKRAKHEGVPWKTTFHNSAGFQFDKIRTELDKYERAYAEPIFIPTTPSRHGKRQSYDIVRLCSATLVIVPPNLMIQWQQEIQKHIETDQLDVLVLDSPTKAVPPWNDLLKYDVVLMTKARLEQEYRDDDLNQGKSKKGDARYISPLTSVRWLRVICDEGHGFAGSSSRTKAMAMLDKMYIERRWVVSGTPSSTLHGVEVGVSTTDSSTQQEGAVKIKGRRGSIATVLERKRAPTVHDQEAKDLERLRLIVVNFLRLQPWANNRGSDNANWKKYLAPVVDDRGKRNTPVALREVLQSLIIRHRIEDIDTDLTLPALHTKVVYLDPSYHDKLAYNMFMLVLAANFVTSEREDEDYMFHPRNRHKFDLLINNMRQATFHWVGFTEQNLRDTIKVSGEYMDKNADTMSDTDSALLTEAIRNGERALHDRSWLAFSRLHEIGVYAQNFPEHASEAWAMDGRASNPVLLGTVQARTVQKFCRDQLLNSTQDPLSGLAGLGIRIMNAARDKAEAEQQEKKKSKSTDDGQKQQMGTLDEPRLKAPSAQVTMPARPVGNSFKSFKNSKPSSSAKIVPQKRRRSSGGDDTDHKDVESSATTPLTPPLSSRSPTPPPPQCRVRSTMSPTTSLSSTSILGFTSSKLSYLISQISLYSDESKCIIFYSGNNTAFWIAEALELVRIPHRIYASTLSITQRNAYLSLFNDTTSEEGRSIRVLLMDLKQASHGLHIACANRVYIVAPIWDKGVESQAIKRAHRIGQTTDVYVETLVLKGTFEEDLIKRRHDIDENENENNQEGGREAEKLEAAIPKSQGNGNKTATKRSHKSILDDRHMSQVLKDVRFLPFTAREDDLSDPLSRIARLTEPRPFFG